LSDGDGSSTLSLEHGTSGLHILSDKGHHLPGCSCEKGNCYRHQHDYMDAKGHERLERSVKGRESPLANHQGCRVRLLGSNSKVSGCAIVLIHTNNTANFSVQGWRSTTKPGPGLRPLWRLRNELRGPELLQLRRA
jgi:hypothetical protein